MSEESIHATPAPPAFPMIRTLGLIALLSGLIVVLVYQWTLPIIEENQRIATEKAVFEVVPDAHRRLDFVLSNDGLLPADGDAEGTKIYAVYNADDQFKGVALPAAAQGYQDMVRLLYSYDPSCQCIRGIKVLKMTETPGLGDKIITDENFVENFEALDATPANDGSGLKNPIVTVKHGTKQNAWEIDAISGATVTSNAVGKALNNSAQEMVPLIHRYLDVFERGSTE